MDQGVMRYPTSVLNASLKDLHGKPIGILDVYQYRRKAQVGFCRNIEIVEVDFNTRRYNYDSEMRINFTSFTSDIPGVTTYKFRNSETTFDDLGGPSVFPVENKTAPVAIYTDLSLFEQDVRRVDPKIEKDYVVEENALKEFISISKKILDIPINLSK